MHRQTYSRTTPTIKTKAITLSIILVLVGLTMYKMHTNKLKQKTQKDTVSTRAYNDLRAQQHFLRAQRAHTIDEVYKAHTVSQTIHTLLHNVFARTKYNTLRNNTHEDEYSIALTLTSIKAQQPVGHYFVHELHRQLHLLEVVCFMRYVQTFPEYKTHFLNIEHMCYLYIDIITELTSHMKQEQKQIHIISSLWDMLIIHNTSKPQIYACMVLECIFNGKRNMYLQPYRVVQNVSVVNKHYVQNVFRKLFPEQDINSILETENIWCQCMLSTSYKMLNVYFEDTNYSNEFLVIFFNTVLCNTNVDTHCAHKLQQHLPHIQHRLRIQIDAQNPNTYVCNVVNVMLNIIQHNYELLNDYIVTLRTCVPQIMKHSYSIFTDEQINLITVGNKLLHIFYRHAFNMDNTKTNKYSLRTWLYDTQFKVSILQQAYHYCRDKNEDSTVVQRYYIDLYNHLVHKTQLQHKYTALRLYTQLHTQDNNLVQHDTIRTQLINCFHNVATFQTLLKDPHNTNSVWRRLLE